MIRSFTSSRPAWSASSTARARGDVVGVLGPVVPRHLQHRVQPGADPADLRRLVGGALQLVDLLERGLAHLLRQVGGLDPGAVVLLLGPSPARRSARPAPCGWRPAAGAAGTRAAASPCPRWTSLRMVSATSSSARCVRGPADQRAPAAATGSTVSSSSLRCSRRQVAGVPGAVGQRRRVGHAAAARPRPATRRASAGSWRPGRGTRGPAPAPRGLRRRLVQDGALDPQRRARARSCRCRSAPGTGRGRPRPCSPPGSRPTCSTTPSVPTGAYLPSSRGTSSTCGPFSLLPGASADI